MFPKISLLPLEFIRLSENSVNWHSEKSESNWSTLSVVCIQKEYTAAYRVFGKYILFFSDGKERVSTRLERTKRLELSESRYLYIRMFRCNDNLFKVNPKYYRPTEVEELLGDATKAKVCNYLSIFTLYNLYSRRNWDGRLK